jgi:DNA (cytosine-5)-methyltransferase 1
VSVRYLSICSGIEAATLAWHPLGWRPQAFAEIDPFACAVLQHRFGCGRPKRMPDHEQQGLNESERLARRRARRRVAGLPAQPANGAVSNLGDFTLIEDDDIGAIDLLVGGTPCQSFSVAGLRAGLADDRGNLALQFSSLARRLRPRWLVWENVPGVLSVNGGRDFGTFLRGVAQCGYGFAWRVLDAQYFGVPQRRRRVFVVGYLGDWRPAVAVLFERASLLGHSPPGREARADAAAAVASGPRVGSGFCNDANAAARNLIAGTLQSSGRAAGSATQQDAESGLLVCRTLYGSSGSGGKNNATQSGLVALAFGGNKRTGPIEVAASLNAHGGPHGRLDFTAETFIAHGRKDESRQAGSGRHHEAHWFDARQQDVIQYGNRAGPLDTDGWSQAIAFETTQITDRENRTRTIPRGAAPALAKGAQTPALALKACARGDNGRGNDRSSGYSPDMAGTFDTVKVEPLLPHGTAPRVRRLTPRECERLQGLPDDWTLVPLPLIGCQTRVRWAADGPRYRAIGNAMNRAVMAWIGHRIQDFENLIGELRVAPGRRPERPRRG